MFVLTARTEQDLGMFHGFFQAQTNSDITKHKAKQEEKQYLCFKDLPPLHIHQENSPTFVLDYA